MRKSSTRPRFFDLQVVNALNASGTRLILVGKMGPAFDAPAAPNCSDCHDFERVITLAGVAICDNPVHAENRPQLPMRPTPHERDGRQNPPAQPTRPRSALLVG
ncbi:hypothetical protein [Streptomyces geranii]|jgi:hypothetical protein|uniref:hypothetical protein n=1 Tax=Streptomyces geranii TaxID=2058923 RepID=UPI000D045795|nr:hypothetical protein [Streptomyces geranii]